MKKSQFIELVRSRANMDYGDRTIALHIEMAFNTVVGQIFRKDPSNLDLYCKSFDVAVIHSTPRSYLMLPCPIIQTIGAANGVRRMFYTGEDTLDFVPVPGSVFQLFSELEAGMISDSIGYYVKSDRVEFMNLPTWIKEVRMEIVAPFSAWDDDEDLPIPDGTADMIFTNALQSIMGELPKEWNITGSGRKYVKTEE